MRGNRVLIREDLARRGHTVLVLENWPNGPAALKSDGTWEQIKEGTYLSETEYGIHLPEGVLDAICREHLGVATPTPATERHLQDALTVRDRLLALVEKRR